MSNATYINPDDLMTRDEVVSKWPQFFTTNELNEAMRNNRISYIQKGRARLLTKPALSEYLANHMVKSCPKDAKLQSSNSADTGSAASADQTPGTGTGMTAEARESAAEALALKILKRPKPSLRAS